MKLEQIKAMTSADWSKCDIAQAKEIAITLRINWQELIMREDMRQSNHWTGRSGSGISLPKVKKFLRQQLKNPIYINTIAGFGCNKCDDGFYVKGICDKCGDNITQED